MKIVLSRARERPALGSGKPQERNADGAPAAGHSAFEPHPDPGLDAGLHPAGAAGGDRQAATTTS